MNDRAAHSMSMLRHSAAYLLARGLSGVIAFLAIPIYTRLLKPEEYGRYALVLAYAVLCNALLFNWIRVSLLRYLPAYTTASASCARRSSRLTSSGALASSGSRRYCSCWRRNNHGASWCSRLHPDRLPRDVRTLLEHDRARLGPWLYSHQLLIKTILSVGTGALFVWLGFGWWGPVPGLTVGMLVPAAWTYARDWASVGFACDTTIIGTAARFGIPVSATVAFAAQMIVADRFLIAWFLGEGRAICRRCGPDGAEPDIADDRREPRRLPARSARVGARRT